jgi:daunorubicin resistance ABC transporter ATP-binding subunit
MTSPTAAGSAIRVEGLRKRFGDVEALAGINFEAPAGTVLGLLGPNGAGKTTAVRILTTVSLPDGGTATVAGHDVVASPQAVRRNIGLAGQYAAVDGNLTGRENLVLVGRLSHLPKSDCISRATALLEQFHLTDAADRPVRTYSGGMRRRLDLAAALVTQPPVLLLDEPTTGLDPASRLDLWDVIEQLVGTGTTVLLTTQYLEEADRLADNIVVIDHGTVVAEGSAADLKSRLGTTTLALSFPDASSAGRATALLAHLHATQPANAADELHLPLVGGASAVRDVLNQLADAGLDAKRIDLHAPTLDDVFLQLTGSRS